MNSNIKIAYIVLCHKNAGQINKMKRSWIQKIVIFFFILIKKVQ